MKRVLAGVVAWSAAAVLVASCASLEGLSGSSATSDSGAGSGSGSGSGGAPCSATVGCAPGELCCADLTTREFACTPAGTSACFKPCGSPGACAGAAGDICCILPDVSTVEGVCATPVQCGTNGGAQWCGGASPCPTGVCANEQCGSATLRVCTGSTACTPIDAGGPGSGTGTGTGSGTGCTPSSCLELGTAPSSGSFPCYAFTDPCGGKVECVTCPTGKTCSDCG